MRTTNTQNYTNGGANDPRVFLALIFIFLVILKCSSQTFFTAKAGFMDLNHREGFNNFSISTDFMFIKDFNGVKTGYRVSMIDGRGDLKNIDLSYVRAFGLSDVGGYMGLGGSWDNKTYNVNPSIEAGILLNIKEHVYFNVSINEIFRRKIETHLSFGLTIRLSKCNCSRSKRFF